MHKKKALPYISGMENNNTTTHHSQLPGAQRITNPAQAAAVYEISKRVSPAGYALTPTQAKTLATLADRACIRHEWDRKNTPADFEQWAHFQPMTFHGMLQGLAFVLCLNGCRTWRADLVKIDAILRASTVNA